MKKITLLAIVALSLSLFTNNTYAQTSTPCSMISYYGNSVDHITDFSTSGATTDISNLSSGAGTSGYSDHTNQILTSGAGDVVSFTIGTSNATGGAMIFIDTNDDGTFAASEAVYASGAVGGPSFSGSFAVPSTGGTYFMRVLFDYGAYRYYTPSTGCGHNGSSGLMYYGEVEDYKITISQDASVCYAPTNVTIPTSTIAQTGVTVSWTDSNSATTFDLEYGVTGFTPGTGTNTTLTGVTNPVTIAGLTAGTTYDIYVAANCDSGSTSDQSTVTSFTTLCADQSGAYSQNFNALTANSAAPFTNEDCWRATAGSEFWKVVDTSDTSSGGTGPAANLSDGNYIMYETSGGDEGDSSTLYSPHLDLSSLTSPLLSFDYHIFGATVGSLSVTLVDASSTSFDILTLTGQQQTAESDAFVTYSTNLSNLSGADLSSVRILFTGTKGSSYTGDIALDNFSISEAPSCGSPTLLSATVADFAMGSASLSWTAGDSNDSYTWNVYAGTDTTAEAVASGTSSTTTATVTGLLSNTSYTAVVAASCGEESGESVATATFTTNHLYTVAYAEDFGTYTNATFLPGQMSSTANGTWNCPTPSGGLTFATFWGDSSPYAGSPTGPSGGGTTGGGTDVYVTSYDPGSAAAGDAVSINTPYFDVSSMTTPRVAIDYHINGTSAGNLTVTLLESDGTETDVISLTGAQQTSSSDAWKTAYGDLSDYNDVIRFRITATYGGTVAIDDFAIEETPTCSAPSNVVITNVTSTTATYSWTEGIGNTEYTYTTTDSANNTIASASGTTTSTTVDVTGLSTAETYSVRIDGVCGSDLATGFAFNSFQTTCDVLTSAFSENFNSESLPVCWEIVNGGDPNGWQHNQTWAFNTGDTFSGGVAIFYNAAAHDDYLYSPEFTVTDGVTDGLSFNALSPNSTWPEPLDISVVSSTTGQTTLIYDDYEVGTYEMAFHSEFYDLSAFEGENIKIAFHSTTTNQNVILLDNFVIGSTSTMSEGWAGFQSGDFANAQNWYAGSVPTGDVTLNLNSDSASNSPVISSSVSSTSLTVNTGAELLISESGSLQTTGDFTNNGTVIMNSTATDHSSLIVGGTSSGSVTYNRYVAADRWYVVSSPVSGQGIDSFISAEQLAVSTNNSSLVALADYNNDGSQYAADPTITTGWWDYHQSGDDGTFTSGQGKIARLASDATDNLLGFTGTISGSVGVPMTVATTAFNLVGNPYPAAVQVTSQGGATSDALSVNTSVLSEETAWFWNSAQGNGSGGYTAVNQNPSQAAKITAPGQGFFVSASGSGDFSFTTAMQTTSAGSFNRQTEWSKIDLSMSAGTQSSETEIVYFDGATTGWDNGYDSTNWSSGSFQIFTSHVDTSTSQNLAIQSLPLGNFNDMVVPVGVNASAGQTITISVDTTNWPEGVNIYLEDVDNGSYTLLDGQNAEFTTLLDSNESGIGRFYIHTTSNSLGDDDLTLTDVSIYASSRDNLRILGINSGQANVQMFDLMGKQVLNTSFDGQSVNDVKLPNLNTGIYLVNLASDEGTINKKIIIQ